MVSTKVKVILCDQYTKKFNSLEVPNDLQALDLCGKGK